MAKTKLTKDGATIYVDVSQVSLHEALGWKATPAVILRGDVLSIDGVDLVAPAASLNALDTPAVAAGTLENLHFRHYQVEPAAVSATAVHAAANLGVAAQEITSGITSPDVPRTVTIKGSVSGVLADVVVDGTNILGEVITDVISLSGASEVEGIKAFATVTKITVPAESHAHAAQVETATVVGTITKAGNATVVVTCTGMTGSAKTFTVAVALNDDASAVADKIRTALGADAAVIALFTVGGTGADIVFTKKTVAANIANLNISIDNGTCEGLTTAGTSVGTVPGVAYDTVSVGMAAKLGIADIVAYAACLLLALFKGIADTGGALAVDDNEIEKNLYTPAGTLDGGAVDLYYLA